MQIFKLKTRIAARISFSWLRKGILLLFIMYNYCFLNSQTNQFSVDSLIWQEIPLEYVIEFNTNKSIPDSINCLITKNLKTFAPYYSRNMQVEKCRYINLEKYFSENHDSINKGYWPLSDYSAIVVWSAPDLGVKRYPFELKLDRFGQILYMGFPRFKTKNDFKFISLDKAKSKADSVIAKDSILYKKPDYNLFFDFCENDMVWQFSYSEKGRNANDKTLIRVRYVAISASKNIILLDESYKTFYFSF